MLTQVIHFVLTMLPVGERVWMMVARDTDVNTVVADLEEKAKAKA